MPGSMLGAMEDLKTSKKPHLLEIYSPLRHKDKPRNVCYMREGKLQ